MLHADTVDESLFSRGNHQMMWILVMKSKRY